MTHLSMAVVPEIGADSGLATDLTGIHVCYILNLATSCHVLSLPVLPSCFFVPRLTDSENIGTLLSEMRKRRCGWLCSKHETTEMEFKVWENWEKWENL